MIYYKIRHKVTGKYSKGGDNKWNSLGKVWTTLGHLRLHISTLLDDPRVNPDFDNWEIIEYEVVEKNVKNVSDVVKADKLIEILTRKA